MISRIRCPGCEDTFKIDTDRVGDLIGCASCGGTFQTEAVIESARKEKRAGAIRFLIGHGIATLLAAFMGMVRVMMIPAGVLSLGFTLILILHRRTRFGWCIFGDIALVVAGLHILGFVWWLCS